MHTAMNLKLKLYALTLGVLLLQPVAADVKVTFLGNEGVLLEADSGKIMIDGFIQESYAIYDGLTESAGRQLAAASGPFSNITIALASHRHFDHFQPDPACRFMRASPSTLIVTSPEVVALAKDRCRAFAPSHRNLQQVIPALGVPHQVKRNGLTVEIFPLSHGSGKYAAIQNYGHLVTLGGMTVIHIGDAAMDSKDFILANLQNRQIDIALIPYWFLVQSSGRLLVEQYLNATHKIAVHIPPKEQEQVRQILAKEMPQVLMFDQRMETRTFTAGQ